MLGAGSSDQRSRQPVWSPTRAPSPESPCPPAPLPCRLVRLVYTSKVHRPDDPARLPAHYFSMELTFNSKPIWDDLAGVMPAGSKIAGYTAAHATALKCAAGARVAPPQLPGSPCLAAQALLHIACPPPVPCLQQLAGAQRRA